MAEVVLFHSALGLRSGVTAAADRLRAVGHTVHTPDYYDVEMFDDLDEDLRKRDELGYDEIYRRAREAMADLPAGWSSPGSPSVPCPQSCWPPGRGPGGGVMHAAIPVEELGGFGVERRPEGVPVQVHYAADDPWVEAEEVHVLHGAVEGAGATFEGHVYPGSGHPFADPDLPEYDRASSEAMWRRVLAFLDRVNAQPADAERR